LLSIIELLFLSLTVEALQGKMCQNSLHSGVGRSLGAKISGGRCHPWGIFFGFYKTRHILLSNGANSTVLHAVIFTQYRRVMDGRTDRRTDRRNCCSLYSACNVSIAVHCKNSIKPHGTIVPLLQLIMTDNVITADTIISLSPIV